MTTFNKEMDEFLSENSSNFLRENNFTNLTEVQLKTIPLFLSYKDVIVRSFTGSGKTLAFLLPVFEMIQKAESPFKFKNNQMAALIVSPTRELASQIFNVALSIEKHFWREKNSKVCLLTGGMDEQKSNEVSPGHPLNIIIGTPGRLCKFLTDNVKQIDLKRFQTLVFDEADRLLENNFEKEVSAILKIIPNQRRTGVFSATSCENLSKMKMRNPVHIKVCPDKQENIDCPVQLENFYISVNASEKFAFLIQFIKRNEGKYRKTIVFFLTCAVVDYFNILASEIIGKGKILSTHGRMAKSKRLKVMEKFKNPENNFILFTTDLLARGIDIKGVDLILQFDAPQDPNFFVHRIGRTARMGKNGETIVILSPFEKNYLSVLEQIKVPISEKSPSEMVQNGDLKTVAISLFKQIRNLAVKDRNILEKGVNAFTSYIRGYKEHHCRSVLRLADIPFGEVANNFGLVYAPKIRDIKEYPRKKRDDKLEGFEEMDVDVSKIKFADKNRQKMHLIKVENIKNRKEKRIKESKEKIKLAKIKKKERRRKSRKTKQNEDNKFLEEWDEFKRDNNLYKKYKRGKISLKDYERAVGERIK